MRWGMVEIVQVVTRSGGHRQRQRQGRFRGGSEFQIAEEVAVRGRLCAVIIIVIGCGAGGRRWVGAMGKLARLGRPLDQPSEGETQRTWRDASHKT